jgi:hypothetical protein
MPSRRQHQHCSDGNHDSVPLMRDQIADRSGPASDVLDPSLFALATILPMGCFPIYNVHPSARYGDMGHKHRRGKSNALYAGMPCNGTMSFPPNIQTQFPGTYRTNNADRFDSMPPLSASTVSSDWISNWSSSEPVAGLGIFGNLDAVPLSGSHAPFAVPKSYPKSTYDPDSLANSFDIVASGQLDNARTQLASCDPTIRMPHHLIQSVESQMLFDGLSSGLSIDLCGGAPSENQSDFQNTFPPAATVSSASELLPARLFSTGYPSPDHPPSHVDREVDSFLDELANVIDWDNIEPRVEDPQTNRVDSFVSQQKNSMNGTTTSEHGLYESLGLDVYGASYAQDFGEDGEDAEFPPSFTEPD